LKALQKKVVLSALVVFVAFLVTIGSTFAWFTVGQSANVNEMNLTINSSESILILLDKGYTIGTHPTLLNNPNSYSSILRNSDFVGYYDITSDGIAMDLLTSVNGVSVTYRNGSTAPFALDTNPDPDVKGAYIQFSVWMLSQSQSVIVSLSDFLVEADNTIVEKNIVTNAVRMSVESNAVTSNTRIFGQDKDYNFAFLQGQVGYSSTASENIIDPDDKTSMETLHGVAFTTGTPVAGESVDDKANASSLFTLLANTPTKVTIRIWIEGWDAQANNNLIAARFDISFGFIVKSVVE
jgi:hypothetical protein